MRRAVTTCLMLVVTVLPGIAVADQSDVVKIFGRDPGTGDAHACFVRHYAKAHLKSHPDQNVTDMIAYVGKQAGPDPYYMINLQVNFRQLLKPFQVSGSCSQSTDGKQTLGCGVECDGGSLSVRVKNESSILVEIPDSVRLFDPAATEEGDLPKGARFGSDDKLFRLDRTELKDCLPVIYDDEIKAKVMSGVITQ
ncbi:hypothetical protein IHQ71_08195 [Rhizobium sp. TH2]|uniref:hypothetical protein n=1 Tax=Rhizobium sp. TH2 TaxID=2775403 RepID=UPI00215724F3|nr:hypothetical protein [Rhizobium sp. TH2]UVC10558.1 hypothetical protein IHQ71_08195 [Rhizobium sp. TH2]